MKKKDENKAFDEKCESLPDELKEIAARLKSKTNKSTEEKEILTGNVDNLQASLIEWYKSQAGNIKSLFANDVQTLKWAMTGRVDALASVSTILERFKSCFTPEQLQDAEKQKEQIEQMKKSLQDFGYNVTPRKPKAKKRVKKTKEDKEK